MGDLSFKNASVTTSIVGADSNGIETTYVDATSKGLKTDSFMSGIEPKIRVVYDKQFRYLECNEANNGVARDSIISSATWTQLFQYSGQGYLIGTLLNLDTFPLWRIRILVDGEDILLGTNGFLSDDLINNTLFDLDNPSDPVMSGLGVAKGMNDKFVFLAPNSSAIYFATSVQVLLKREDGAANKKFQAGFVVLNKVIV